MGSRRILRPSLLLAPFVLRACFFSLKLVGTGKALRLGSSSVRLSRGFNSFVNFLSKH